MTPENHIFISYAHVDNKRTPDSDGWVTRFHEYLESYLSMNLGSEAKIWRDEKLNGNDNFADKIVNQFPNTAALISVISNRYVESPWCIREADTFCDVAEKNKPGLQVKDKTRLFKVKLNPIEDDQRSRLPDPMREILGYEFFEEIGDKTILLDPEFGDQYKQSYKQKIYLLAQDIAETLKLMKNGVAASEVEDAVVVEESASAVETEKLVIYLAECGYDQSQERTSLYGMLREKYTILPDIDLPRVESQYQEDVQAMMARCDLSIHLMGQGNGGILDGPGQISPVQLQHELALKSSEERGMKRLIWMPDSVVGDAKNHQDFLQALGTEAKHLLHGDLIAGNFKELEAEVLHTLDVLEEERDNASEDVAPDSDSLSVYVICDAKDVGLPDFAQLMVYLQGQGFNISVPLFTGEAEEVQTAHEEQIKNSDAILLFFGEGDGGWKRAQESELKRVMGLRTNKRVSASYVYLGGESTPDKQVLTFMSPTPVINGLNGFSADILKPFTEKLQQSK